MAPALRVPPGRAGRLWLQHRVEVAERAAGLLDQKVRILHAELRRLQLREQRTSAAWTEACAEAATWLVRAVLLGGERAVRLAGVPGTAQVELIWAQSMGVRYPAEARCAPAQPPATAAPPGSVALVRAGEAHRRALQAAVAHAAARTAVRAMQQEEAATRRRLRAVEQRLLPRLREALRVVQLALEEQEHTEAVRLRWAAGVAGPGTGAGSGTGTGAGAGSGRGDERR